MVDKNNGDPGQIRTSEGKPAAKTGKDRPVDAQANTSSGGTGQNEQSDNSDRSVTGTIARIKKWFKQGKDESTILDWRSTEHQIIARIIPREIMAEQLFFRKKVTIHPGEALLVMRRGTLQAAQITSGQYISSGLIDRIKKTVGYGEDVIMMAVDTADLILRVSAGLSKYQLIYDDPEFAEKMRQVLYRTGDLSENLESVEQFYEPDVVGLKVNLHTEKDLEVKERNIKLLKFLGLDFSDEHGKAPLLSKDRESIVLDVKLSICLHPDNCVKIYKLVSREADGTLSLKALETLIGQELSVRVFAPRIRRHTADELRLNTAIIEEMQTKAEEELGGWLSGYGVTLKRLSLNPAITDQERSIVKEKELNALLEMARNQHVRLKDEAERDFERSMLSLKHHQATLIAEREGTEALDAIARASLVKDKQRDISIEQLDARIKEIHMSLDAKAKQLEFLGIKRRKDFEWDFEKQKRLLEAQLKSKALQDKTDADVRLIDAKTKAYVVLKQEKLAEMEKRRQIERHYQEHSEKILDKASAAGELSADVAIAAIEGGTTRKALDQSGDVAKAYGEAEGKKHTKRVFKEGLKEQPSIGFSGKGKVIVTRQVSLNNGMIAHDDGLKKINCPNCSRAIPVDAKICGYCEYAIAKQLDR
jgi:hypothetical protein